jgi:acetyl esterase/lipase
MPAMTSFANLPPADRARMLKIGPVWATDVQGHRDLVFAAYVPLLSRAPKSGGEVVHDKAYGPYPRQVVDVYRASGERPGKRQPVVLFVHGGAFVRGEKDSNAEIYSNVCHYFARHGCVAINDEYRLATDAPYPEGARDIARAVDWARTHAAEYGGDPERLFIVGHSAGGTHVASYAFDPALHGDLRGVRGVMLISARLRADNRPDNPNAHGVRAYWGADESLYDQRSPVTHAAASKLPMLIAVAEYENPYLDVYGAELLYRVAAARGRAPEFIRLAHHNHISIIAHVNTDEDFLGGRMRAFVAEHAGDAA